MTWQNIRLLYFTYLLSTFIFQSKKSNKDIVTLTAKKSLNLYEVKQKNKKSSN